MPFSPVVTGEEDTKRQSLSRTGVSRLVLLGALTYAAERPDVLCGKASFVALDFHIRLAQNDAHLGSSAGGIRVIVCILQQFEDEVRRLRVQLIREAVHKAESGLPTLAMQVGKDAHLKRLL